VVFWLALILLIVVSLVGLLFAIARGFQLYRQAKQTSATLTGHVEKISRGAEEIQANLERAQRAQGDLQQALTQLQGSRKTLDVQLAAVKEARAMINSIIPIFGTR
jgi:ABC-type siderophore export system fused ATPase/permease subunit